jgi:hypothetical protein
MSRETANYTIAALLGGVVGGSLVGCATIATASAAFVLSSVLLVVWLVALMVWFLWG